MKQSSSGLFLAIVVTGGLAVWAYHNQSETNKKYYVWQVSGVLAALFLLLFIFDSFNILTPKKKSRKHVKECPDKSTKSEDDDVEPFAVSYPVPEPANMY
jgi:hypothetical protein